eukprot:1795596-Pleurochrysis_carterae.AAC.1
MLDAKNVRELVGVFAEECTCGCGGAGTGVMRACWRACERVVRACGRARVCVWRRVHMCVLLACVQACVCPRGE